MGQKAFKERLKQIKMSEFDAELYERFLDGVRGQIKSLRIILDSLQVSFPSLSPTSSTDPSIGGILLGTDRSAHWCDTLSAFLHYY